MTKRRAFLAGVAATLVAGCSGGSDGGDGASPTASATPDDADGDAATPDESATPNDADGDGVPDSEDYAPRDPEVQEKSDLQGDDGDSDDGGLEKVEDGGDGGERTDGGKPTDDGKDRTDDEPAKGSGRPDVLLDKQVELDANEQRVVRIRIDEPATLEYEFRTVNLPMDVFLTSNAEYVDFRQGKEVRMIDAGTTLDARSDSVAVGLEPLDDDHHVLVFDNTDRGEAGPSDNVTLDDAITAQVRVVLYR